MSDKGDPIIDKTLERPEISNLTCYLTPTCLPQHLRQLVVLRRLRSALCILYGEWDATQKFTMPERNVRFGVEHEQRKS